ncbi:MAG: hypothetical protein HY226_03505 [Candidatus Vogelbacteria bacterium]|nr:hypothetical protein [Candidatus Vogelbacteria bacterium]
MKKEVYIEPETGLSIKKVKVVDPEDAGIMSTFDRITEKIIHGRTKDESGGRTGGMGATEMMTSDAIMDFVDLGIPEKVLEEYPDLARNWLLGKSISEDDLNILKRCYLKAIKKGKIHLPPEYLN